MTTKRKSDLPIKADVGVMSIWIMGWWMGKRLKKTEVFGSKRDAKKRLTVMVNCRLPLAPLDYGETCAYLFRYINHTQHLHSAGRVVGRMDRFCGQIKAALWLLGEWIAGEWFPGFDQKIFSLF